MLAMTLHDFQVWTYKVKIKKNEIIRKCDFLKLVQMLMISAMYLVLLDSSFLDRI